MNITLEDLQKVKLDSLKVPYAKKMLQSTLHYVGSCGGKAWVHPEILADLGIAVREGL